MYIYIYIYVYIYFYIYVYIYMHTNTDIYIYTHIKIYIQVHIIHTFPFYFTLHTPPFQPHSTSNPPVLFHIIPTSPLYLTLCTPPFQPLHFKHTQTHSISNTKLFMHTYSCDFTLHTLPFLEEWKDVRHDPFTCET